MKTMWRTWHLVAIFAVGSVLMWVAEQMKEWAGQRLTSAWFDDDDDDDDEEEDR